MELSAENSQFLQQQVALGAFATPEEALDAAIGLLRQQATLRDKVLRGAAQLERGEYLELDDEGLANFFATRFGCTPSDRAAL